MKDVPNVGSLCEGTGRRDAIHVAVVAVEAADELRPGQHVAFVKGSTAKATGKTRKGWVGIVDPFLVTPVQAGERFWLCLYPNTITSLRHDWTHPAFEPDKLRRSVDEIAATCGLTYKKLIGIARDFAQSDYEEWTYDNSESYKDVPHEKWDDLWAHIEAVTGEKLTPHESWNRCPFTCSC